MLYYSEILKTTFKDPTECLKKEAEFTNKQTVEKNAMVNNLIELSNKIKAKKSDVEEAVKMYKEAVKEKDELIKQYNKKYDDYIRIYGSIPSTLENGLYKDPAKELNKLLKNYFF